MIERPRWKAHLQPLAVSDTELILVAESTNFLVGGRASSRLAPLLDGSRTVDELLVESGLPLGEVLGCLTRLERAGYLADGQVSGDADAHAWWESGGSNFGTASGNIANSTVELIAPGGSDTDDLARALTSSGIPMGGDDGLAVVVVDDYLDPALASLNDRFLAAARSWLPARLRGQTLWLGPHFRPGNSACWACLAQRLAGNRQVDRYLERNGRQAIRTGSTVASLPSTRSLAASLVVTEIAEILAVAGSGHTNDTLVTFDVVGFRTERHHVVRLPQCPACGDPSIGTAAVKIELTRRPKVFTADGGHRTERPEVTYDRLAKHVSPITGAITSLQTQVTEDNGVAYSYSAGHNFALMQNSTYLLRKNLRGRSGGKGRTDVQAKVSAMGEAIERYTGVYRGDEPSRRIALEDAGPGAVPIDQLLLFSDEQYLQRDAWNAEQTTSYHIVPARLDPREPIDWTRVWSLADGAEREVPSAYCWFGHPDIARSFFCASDANGNAAGNTLEEAILQGLMELVERDAVAIWWYNRLQRPAIDLDRLGEPYLDALREHYDRLDRDLWVLDLTNDLGIPAMAGVSARRSGPAQDVVIGFGAHLDSRMAVLRALSEVNQFLPAVTERNDDGTTNYWMDDPDAIHWWRTATLESEPYVAIDSQQPAVDPRRYDGFASDDLAHDVRAAVERTGAAGYDVLVLDQTRPDIELNVAKVMCPGLRHFWRRLGPGRLYDVPVALGWLDSPTAEADLNPISIFF